MTKEDKVKLQKLIALDKGKESIPYEDLVNGSVNLGH